jgi:hypothetical protein
VNKKASLVSLFAKGVILFSGCAFLCSTLGLIDVAQAQTTKQSRQKVVVQPTKQVGLKDKSSVTGPKTSSMSLNPSLFQRKAPDELMLDSDANLDYRVTQGCLRRNFFEDNLPESIGIDNRQFSEFFKNQTKTFFDRMRGDCIP